MEPKQTRLYCWPNRFGFTYFLVFIFMLAVGGTYQNNLVFMMAFILLALGLVTIIQTARNLRDVRLLSVTVHADDEGNETYATLVLKNEHKTKAVERIRLKLDKKWYPSKKPVTEEIARIEAGSLATARVPVHLPSTWGILNLGRVSVGTTFPYGLFNTWFIIKSKEDVFVYPRPSLSQLAEPVKRDLGDDFSGHKKYEHGDSYARMDWKLAARGKGLNTKQYKSPDVDRIELIFNKDKDSVREMASRLKTARINGYEWSFRTPIDEIQLAKGPNHYHRSMKLLVRSAL